MSEQDLPGTTPGQNAKTDKKRKRQKQQARPAKQPLRRTPEEIAQWSRRLLPPAFFLLLAVLAGLYLISARIAWQPDVALGLWVGETHLGGTPAGELRTRLKEIVPEPDAALSVTLATDGWQTSRSFGELSVQIDWEELERQLLLPGHEGGLFRRMWSRVSLRRNPRRIPVPVRFDADRANALLQQVHETIYRPATGATLELQPRKAILHAGTDGETVDIALLASRLLGALQTRQSATVRIPRQRIPSPRLDPEALREAIERKPQNASIARNRDGTFTLVRSSPGRSVELSQLTAVTDRLELRSDRQSVSRELPLTITEPETTEEDIREELEKAGLLEEAGLISAASFETVFPTTTGMDRARAVNIALAAQAIDGRVLAPGEEFSFNGATGPRTRAKGYVEALAYAGGRVVTDLGGGICQVSTTLFNAMLSAGLEPVERHAHSFTVFYAAPGRDASVSYGSQDLRFRNPFPVPVRLHVQARQDRLRVDILVPEATPLPQVMLYTRILTPVPSRISDATSPETPTDASGQASGEVGLNGAVVETWSQTYSGGNLIGERRLYVSRYAPYPVEVLTRETDASSGGLAPAPIPTGVQATAAGSL